MSTYPCIGGPLDGKTRQFTGCPYFYTTDLPSPANTISYSQRDEISVATMTVKKYRYDLCDVPGVGKAWMNQP